MTRDCLLSVENLDYPNYKIICVDNGSEDNSAPRLAKEFLQVDFLELDKNYGFTGGNNKGISHAIKTYSPDYFLLLNNDTEVEPDLITKLIEPFDQNKKVYATVPKIYYFNKKNVIWFAGGRVRRFTGNVKEYGMNKPDNPDYSIQKETGFMTGCAALISNNAITDIGMFDDRFFAYSEDTDLSMRILKSDHSIIYVPKAVVYHKISQSFKKNKRNWFKNYLATRNIVLLQQKHLPKIIYPIFVIWFLIRWVLYLSFKYSIRLQFKQIPFLFRGYLDGIFNKSRYNIP